MIIATHAPLIVTGALAETHDLVSVFQVARGEVEKIELRGSKSSSESIEEILWRAFDVITPANHFISEELVGIVSQLEKGAIGVDAALARVEEMDEKSFDSQQREFFDGVRKLLVKVQAERDRQRSYD